MDPQQPGIAIEKLRGSQTAVFGATMSDDYAKMMSKDSDTAPPQTVTGGQPGILPNRISCSFLSPDSKCFSFDARANGYARGEGIVAPLLRPLHNALRDGDIIRAVVRGTGSNQDVRTPTLTQPSAESQEALIRRVYAQAGLGFEDTRYFEAHGTGTSVGDPIEVSAIGNVLSEHRSQEEPLLVGSVKANIGHLEGPVEVPVPIKSTLWPTSNLRRVSVNSFGYRGTNSHIILDGTLHYLESHGLSGYHHCTVVPSISEEPIVNGAVHSTTTSYSNDVNTGSTELELLPIPKLLIWSAADSNALERIKHTYQDYYQAHIVGSSAKTDQLAYTLAARRSAMPWRTFAVVDGQEKPIDKEELNGDMLPLSLAPAVRALTKKPIISFVFTGQGAQYLDMGLGSGWSIFNELRNEKNINRPEFSQSLCTVLHITLIDLLSSFGVTSTAVVGNSSGEIATAYTTGAISHESACKVAYFRGKVIKKLRSMTETTGAMIAANIPEPEVPAYLAELDLGSWKDTVRVACVNSPTNVTLSGPSEAIDILKIDLDQRGIFAQKLNTGVAYHSPAMLAVADEYASLMGTLESEIVKSQTRPIHMISSVNNMVSPVRFADAIKLLRKKPEESVSGGPEIITDIVEIGAHSALRRPIKDSVSSPLRYHSVLERKKSSPHTMLTVLGTLWCHKYPVSILAGNLQAEGNFPFLVDCPPYPFDHSRRYCAESKLSKEFRLRPSSPGYMLGRRNHDWNALRPQWRNWLSMEAMPWLGDHIVSILLSFPSPPSFLVVTYHLHGMYISNEIICPGTGMVALAIEAVRQETAANHRTISGFLLRKAQFLAPITVGKTAQTVTETVLRLHPVQNTYEKEQTCYEINIFTYRDERWTQYFRTDCKVQHEEANKTQVDGGLENQIWQEQFRQRFQEATEFCNETVERSAFYRFCDEHGIHYGETFQLLRDIEWDGNKKSTARIDLTAFKKQHEMIESPAHPAVLDVGIHLLLVQISKGLGEDSATVVPQRIANVWISAKAWSGSRSSLRLNSILHAEPDSPGSLKGSVWALADDGSPLCSVEDVILTEVSQPNQSKDDSDDQLLKLCDDTALVHNETFEDKWALKVESAMRLATRKALRDFKEVDLDRALSYMRRYLKSLEHLYATPSAGETKDISDSELDLLLEECEIMNPDCETYLANQQMRDGRFAKFLDIASHEKPTLNILEIGAGTGSMARHIIGSLNRFEKETGQYRLASYTYTDISPMFFEAAQEEFGDFHGRLLYKTVDLERLVLHATSNLEATLGRVRQLLRPGAHIVMQEVVATNSARANVTFGSLPGWWLSTEEWREYTPLLTADLGIGTSHGRIMVPFAQRHHCFSSGVRHDTAKFFSEEPEKHIVTLIAESGSPSTTVKHVLNILDKCFGEKPASPEIEFVVRGGHLTIARLMKGIELDAERPPVALEIGVPGMLDALRFVEDTAYNDALGPDEVEIEAVSWPISFRDVFVALGRLGMEGLGVECAGVVTRTGNESRLQRGEKILIHSGAGSTGQMAIAMAQWLGAEVFTTVGLDEKKKLLIDRFGIPDDHIFYSRNTTFAKGIMRVTKGYGVDVVLNSLSGEGLRASWKCIAPYGRFVEIGKADIGIDSSLPMGSFARNTSFAAVDLVHLSATNVKLFRHLIEVVTLISQGDIDGPEPLHLYPASSVEKAFRYMQSGKNTGRIIMTGRDEDPVPKFLTLKSDCNMDANASYVVAGGFGGIGRAILRWMADRGAKNLIVPSTSGTSSQAAVNIVSEFARRGVRVITKICNAASDTDLAALLQDCAVSMPPIKGCINAAMVLQDSVFENMTHAQWTKTIRSKVNTSWNLHKLLPKDMDFFILLSSIAGIYGSPGQSNYAAGCTFQDALARSGSAAGYRGSVAINLGWMRTIGIIAETREYQHNRQNVGDMSQVEEADFFALLEHYCNPLLPLLGTKDSQVLIGVITQTHVHARGEAPIDVLKRPLFAGFSAPQVFDANKHKSTVSTQEDPAVLFRQAATPQDRSVVVVSALKAKLARALDVSVDDVDSHRNLSDYGTDPLMAVELRNWIRRDFGVSIAIFDLLGGAEIAALGDLIAKK
ncbi:dae50dc7-2c16-4c37-8a7b-ae80d7e5f4a2 [Sclerotinia trifoliorum]|uniref:Dae50dc7-2c16-4c37-8a7b-ae80d7e5f4a2 n=1 Tax=Sclerotinia trifoliorum TaxID=28548 RepID=A0A8H2VUU7_9HELO|nr:dae50dc7-2c16-4c37-8a7b-ae80d7e5f4a2 [Sclerotinia trifoliorum]